ncbi:MAG: LysM peptidoglycan-binding protein [Glaciihabitans sp.]|nr:LysM peptidoglycan-binding protein [Glaciihabitans sp.]
MTGFFERDAHSQLSPLAGLKPSRLHNETPDREQRDRTRIARSMLSTVPIVLVGSLAVAGLNLTGNLDSGGHDQSPRPKTETADLSASVRAALATANAATTNPAAEAGTEQGTISVAEATPSTYRVQGGDTVSSIAGRYGLSTASVLALNGLGWKSTIFPGQVLSLSNSGAPVAAAPVEASAPVVTTSASSTRYTIAKGDTVGGIASKFGVSVASILAANSLDVSSVIYAGRTLNIPGGGETVVSAPTSVAAATSPSAAGSYTIKPGDTITGIAKQFGIGTQALLEANGLSASSIIFSDQKLVIPAAGGVQTASVQTAAVVSAVTSGTTQLSGEMAANARVIVRVGQQLGVPDYGIVVALAAAMQESSLRNVTGGDRDSIGLFQQRPSTGWGTPEQLIDAEYASRLFYGGNNNPNVGNTSGLLDVSNWQNLSVSQAAQKVQISGHPTAYAQWESSARAWLAELK